MDMKALHQSFQEHRDEYPRNCRRKILPFDFDTFFAAFPTPAAEGHAAAPFLDPLPAAAPVLKPLAAPAPTDGSTPFSSTGGSPGSGSASSGSSGTTLAFGSPAPSTPDKLLIGAPAKPYGSPTVVRTLRQRHTV